MKFISIDLETTGNNPVFNQVIEIGMVAVDTDTDPSDWKSTNFIVYHDFYKFSATAAKINHRIIDILSDHENEKNVQDYDIVPIDIAWKLVENFVVENGYVKNKNDKYYLTFAGKNVGAFDLQFFRNMPGINQIFQITNRVLDPAILYVDFKKDKVSPSFESCKERAGMKKDVSHVAVEDAWDIVMLVMNKLSDINIKDMLTLEYVTLNGLKKINNSRFEVKPGLEIYKNDDVSPFRRFKLSNGEYVWSKQQFKKILFDNES